MKAAINLPDALYREVEAESARKGRSVREVTIALFQRWLAPSPGTSVPRLVGSTTVRLCATGLPPA